MNAHVAVFGWALLLPLSCANGLAGEVREHTYPAEFQYVPRQELRTQMERLAQDARALDALLAREPLKPPAELRPLVLSILRDMRDAAQELEPHGARTNHPFLEQHIPTLIAELDAAERAADLEQPSFYLAASIAGACVHCHQAK